MMRFVGRSWSAWLAVLVGVQWWTAVPAPGQQWQTLPQEERMGAVVDIGPAPGMLQVRLPKEGATIWAVMAAPDARVEVTGVASREMLQAGQFVSVGVTIDETGKVTEPVTRVVFPGGGVPGVTTPGLGVGEPGAKRLPGKRPAGDYLVSGPIRLVKEDVITVQAGRDKFEISIPDTAELVVNTRDIGLVGRGDTVDVEGKFLQRGQLVATTLSVTLANPVSPPPKKGARPTKKAAP